MSENLQERILEALTDEEMEELENGEKLEVLIRKREPVITDGKPTSMNTITLTLKTKGTVGGLTLEGSYPDVIGLDDENS